MSQIPGALPPGPVSLNESGWEANRPFTGPQLADRLNALHRDEHLSANPIGPAAVVIVGTGYGRLRLVARVGWWLSSFGQLRDWWDIDEAVNTSFGATCVVRQLPVNEAIQAVFDKGRSL